MKWMITRVDRSFAIIEADSENEALRLCEMGLVPECEWSPDDRPYEYSNDLGEPYCEESEM